MGTNLVHLPSEVWMHIFYYCVDRYLRPSSMTFSEIVSASDFGVPASIAEWKERIEEEKTREPVLFPMV